MNRLPCAASSLGALALTILSWASAPALAMDAAGAVPCGQQTCREGMICQKTAMAQQCVPPEPSLSSGILSRPPGGRIGGAVGKAGSRTDLAWLRSWTGRPGAEASGQWTYPLVDPEERAVSITAKGLSLTVGRKQRRGACSTSAAAPAGRSVERDDGCERVKGRRPWSGAIR